MPAAVFETWLLSARDEKHGAPSPTSQKRIKRQPVLGGLISEYERAA